MSLATLHDLLLHELRDLYNAEHQILRALPVLARKATAPALTKALERHARQTEQQEARLERCFEILGVAARGKHCKGMEGLLTEGREMVEEAENETVRDAAIIGGCQKVEHYEICGYGTARAFAEKLGHEDIAALLGETLEEEAATNERLTEIADRQAWEQTASTEAAADTEESNEAELTDDADEEEPAAASRARERHRMELEDGDEVQPERRGLLRGNGRPSAMHEEKPQLKRELKRGKPARATRHDQRGGGSGRG